jgi:hypothetical protein
MGESGALDGSVKCPKLEASYENLALLMEEDVITIPDYHELQAELDVFKSGFTFDGAPTTAHKSRSNQGSTPCVSSRMTSARH